MISNGRGGQQSRAVALLGVIGHGSEMYGIGTVYLRLKGQIPPSTELFMRGRGAPAAAGAATGAGAVVQHPASVGRLRYLEPSRPSNLGRSQLVEVPAARHGPRARPRAHPRVSAQSHHVGAAASARRERGWRIVVPELRGFGDGAGDPPTTSMTTTPGTPSSLLDALHIETSLRFVDGRLHRVRDVPARPDVFPGDGPRGYALGGRLA